MSLVELLSRLKSYNLDALYIGISLVAIAMGIYLGMFYLMKLTDYLLKDKNETS